jgi:hypothetical protein
MTDRYRVDADAMTAAAGRLDEAAEDVRAAAELLAEGAGDDLGPGGVTEEAGGLTEAWTARLSAVHEQVASGAAGVRAARDAYLDVDDVVTGELNRGG